MTPFLIGVLGVPAPTAVGTDLVQATVTKLTGSVKHYRQRSVNLEVAIFLGLGSIPASLLGVQTLEWLKASYDAAAVNSMMKEIIAVTLVLTGASLIVRVEQKPPVGEVVLYTSALLALLNREPRHEEIVRTISRAAISTVNLSEVAAKLDKPGYTPLLDDAPTPNRRSLRARHHCAVGAGHFAGGVEEVDGTCVIEVTLFPRTLAKSVGLEFEA